MIGDGPPRPPADAVVCERLHKSFGAVRALDGADLRVPRGSVVGLLGENGAGKSTLVRLIAGELRPDSGRLEVSASVGLVRQQLSTVPELTVLENLAFGAERSKRARSRLARALGLIDWRDLRARATQLIEQTALDVPLDRLAGDLPAGLQQRTELLGALMRGAEILLLDEPTTYLTPHEVDRLFDVIRDLGEQGVSTVFISHKLREVADNCDEVTVLRKGRTTARFSDRPFDLGAIGRGMTGEDAPALAPRPRREALPGKTRLRAAHGALHIRAGEIVGVAGVAGNGQDELVATLAGLAHDPRYGPVILDGVDMTRASTWQRREHGLRVIPSNVKAAGCAPTASLTDNVLTAMVPVRLRGPFGILRRATATLETEALIRDGGITARDPRQRVGELSGGNLQRLAVARELGAGDGILVAHEPTRGVDFAAAGGIHARLRDFTARGGAILLLTSDLDELLALSDRVHVLYEGQLGKPWACGDLSLARLGELLGGLGHGGDLAVAAHA